MPSNPSPVSEAPILGEYSSELDCVDDACILGPADCSLLVRPTTVAYSRALVGTVANVELLINQGHFVPVTAIPAVTLDWILQGARDSRELSADKKRLIG